jgi:hypothetical protein
VRQRVALAVAGLLLAACAHVAAPPPARAQGPDLERWLGDLDSPRPSVYRIATAYVAHAGPVALDSLAARLPGASPVLRAHVKLVVGVMLLTSVTLDDMARRPALRNLGAAELAAAARDAAALCASREYETDIGVPSDSTMRHHDALVALRGWAVPAAVSLTQCKGASGRVFGMHLLMEVKAGGQAAALAALSGDSTVVIAGEDEPQERTSIAVLAASYARAFPFSNHGLVVEGGVPRTLPVEAEEFLGAVARQDGVDMPEYALVNRLRDDAKTKTARTWDEYWQRARPVLESMWDAPAAPSAAPTKETPR